MHAKKLATFLIVGLLLLAYCQTATTGSPTSPTTDTPTADTQQAAYKYYFDISELLTLVGLVFLALMMVLCTLGGIGGNIVILPVCLVFFQFDTHVAVGHTTFFSAISSLVRVGVEIFKKSNKKNLNFDAALLSLTPCIIGSVIGVFLNKMCPNILILAMATLLLVTLLIKAIKDYKKMSADEEKGENRLKVKSELIELEHYDDHDHSPNKEGLLESQQKEEEDVFDPTPQSGLHDQYALTQNDTFFYLIIFCVNPLFSLLRGTKDRPSIIGIERCGGNDVLLVISYMIFLAFLTRHLKHMIQGRNRFVKQNVCNVDFKAEDATNRLLVTMIAVGFVGSFLAAGYSVLLNMALMMLELTPFIASATGLYIGVVFSLASAVVFYFEGLLYFNCALIGGIVIAVSTLAVRLTLYEKFVKSGKGSYTLFFMSIMLGMGIVSTISVIAPKIKASHDRGENIWAFTSIC